MRPLLLERLQALDPANRTVERDGAPDDTELAAIFATGHDAAQPNGHGPGPVTHRRRRAVLLGIAVTAPLVLVAAGVSGALPPGFVDTFAYWRTDTLGGADPNNATVAASAAGPNGETLEVWTAPGDEGTCMVVTVDVPDVTTPNPFAGGQGLWVSTCGPLPSATEPFAFSTGLGSNGDIATFFVVAGAATRGEVRLDDGTTLPAVVVNGYLCGWSPEGGGAVLIAYDDTGTEVGRISPMHGMDSPVGD